MKTLVTGGAGFLGAHLVELLLKLDHEVLVIDSLWTGSEDAIKEFKKNESFSYINRDVIEPFPSDLAVDQVYHLACPASPKRFSENPVSILRACFEGTRNVLELARRCNARVLIASTSEVYGDPQVHPQPESYWGNVNPFGPRACYDEGKRVVESLAYAYQQQYGVSVRIARIFNAYGPGLLPEDGRVVSNFIVAALAGRNIQVTGDGKSTRCFQFATDCISSLVKLMGSEIDVPVNIGSDEEIAIGELAVIIRDLVAHKIGQPPVGISMTSAPPDDPVNRKPELSLARKALGLETRVSLLQGLELSVDWYMARVAQAST